MADAGCDVGSESASVVSGEVPMYRFDRASKQALLPRNDFTAGKARTVGGPSSIAGISRASADGLETSGPSIGAESVDGVFGATGIISTRPDSIMASTRSCFSRHPTVTRS